MQKSVLSDEARKARAAYKKAWREANPEKVAEYERRFWEKKAREAQAADEEKAVSE